MSKEKDSNGATPPSLRYGRRYWRQTDRQTTELAACSLASPSCERECVSECERVSKCCNSLLLVCLCVLLGVCTLSVISVSIRRWGKPSVSLSAAKLLPILHEKGSNAAAAAAAVQTAKSVAVPLQRCACFLFSLRGTASNRAAQNALFFSAKSQV